MSQVVKYNGMLGLTSNGWANTFVMLANLAQDHLRANGWGVSQFQIIGGNNFSFVLNVDCAHNAETLVRNLEQTILGTSTAIFGTVFSSVRITSLSGLQNTCVTGGTGSTGVSTYTVVAGDTFSKIARRYGLSVAQLSALNPQVTNINLIHVGDVLNVSGRPSVTVATSVNSNTGQVNTVSIPPVGNGNNVSPAGQPQKNWFDRAFFDGAGTLTGAGIGVLVVLGVIVVTRIRR